MAETSPFERVYVELEDKKSSRLVKARKKRSLDLDQLKCIKDDVIPYKFLDKFSNIRNMFKGTKAIISNHR